ncbi:MAG: bifunctional phosphoribosylaminoimidazolecarboxamide formyltransferase/IMP cyclohydrolase [Candidatus Omnitrophota bacterium]
MKVERALVSVSDKTGLEAFVRGLHKLGIEIMSTGGTAKAIDSLGVPVTEVSSYTGFPEMLDGRLKTLHPKIHGGILAVRGNKSHMEQVEKAAIMPIDMVVVNLYPFEDTVSRKGVTLSEAIENIDIGGPAMLRSAAKNYSSVAVVSSCGQYEAVLKELEENGAELSAGTLKKLAVKVFDTTSRYDGSIARYLSGDADNNGGTDFPEEMDIRLKKVRALRYGENPHQRAAFYRDSSGAGVADARQFQGKELSYNNIMDLNAALEIIEDFKEPAVSVIKHNNPCGVATAGTPEKAFVDALDCDRLSAFGSIIGFNRPVDSGMAEIILGEADFVECIIAPGFDEKALGIFSAKKNLRVLALSSIGASRKESRDIRKVRGGALVQDRDEVAISAEDLKLAAGGGVDEETMKSLLFGWRVVKHVKSNAIVLSSGTKTVGIGAGQMSRVDSVIIAVRKAGDRAKGAVLASDAFFPKADSIEAARMAGIKAIIQPGGSIRDGEVIEACNRFGISMFLTGRRHFKH